ncbi:MAG: hypothetical protein ACRC76_10640 [Proteocatella sp.]
MSKQLKKLSEGIEDQIDRTSYRRAMAALDETYTLEAVEAEILQEPVPCTLDKNPPKVSS